MSLGGDPPRMLGELSVWALAETERSVHAVGHGVAATALKRPVALVVERGDRREIFTFGDTPPDAALLTALAKERPGTPPER